MNNCRSCEKQITYIFDYKRCGSFIYQLKAQQQNLMLYLLFSSSSDSDSESETSLASPQRQSTTYSQESLSRYRYRWRSAQPPPTPSPKPNTISRTGTLSRRLPVLPLANHMFLFVLNSPLCVSAILLDLLIVYLHLLLKPFWFSLICFYLAVY